MLADVLARTLLSPAELPIGVVTAFFGAPFFAVVLRTSRGGAMIETRDLWVRFGPVAAVRELSLRAESGGWTALIGPNGAGKTSALRALAGLVPYDGEVLLDGQDARRLGRRALARLVAFVPQKPETPPALTVAEYVLLGRTPHISYLGGEGRRDREAAARARCAGSSSSSSRSGRSARSAAASCSAPCSRARSRRRRRCCCSTSRRRRSTSAGSSSCSSSSTRLRKDGLTVVTTMHDLTLAGQYAQRLVLLDGGAVVAEGTAAEVLSAPNVAAHYGANVRIIEDGAGVVRPSAAQPLESAAAPGAAVCATDPSHPALSLQVTQCYLRS